jgi:hypothetical protein
MAESCGLATTIFSRSGRHAGGEICTDALKGQYGSRRGVYEPD